ncbi:hypothetical protein LMTR3_21325 [Bradyrhizobium sp. LMTR 3]|nr:hypothetical protein LMTR3_21325 [Bradyrhizobium sp. LMTR 3]
MPPRTPPFLFGTFSTVAQRMPAKRIMEQMALGGIDAAICARRDIIGPFAMLSDAERGLRG